jgi:ubiquinone/menaquinone biosynthesis C-methylase UbiE
VEAPTVPMLFARHHYETQLIRRLLASDPPARTLEFGCGFGRLSPTFAELSASHTAVDINVKALEAARAAYSDLTFLAVDGENLPFPDGSFDLVTTWTVLQHIPPHKIDHAIAELMRVRSAEGRVLLCEETYHAGSPSRHSWHREPSFYEQAFRPLQMTYSSYIKEIDQLAGLRSPGRVMLFESPRAPA